MITKTEELLTLGGATLNNSSMIARHSTSRHFFFVFQASVPFNG